MKKKIGLLTAIAIVIANMIGTGVFTSVGFQLPSAHNTIAILLLWLAGGVLALFGAFAYAELGTTFKESGGDYIYLSRLFHPVLGYLSAWAGLIIGFSAPVALAAMAFTKYMAPFGLQNNIWIAIIIIVLIGFMHSFTLKHSSRFQNLTTIVKAVFIITLILIGCVLPAYKGNALDFGNAWQHEMTGSGYAVSMIYVSYAYTGWNAAAYVAGEIDKPRRNLPAALIASTLFVAAAYVSFQYVLLKHASISELQGREEVTFISFSNLLGSTGGKWVSAFIGIQLIATISSYLWVGPRVTMAMGKEHVFWKPLSAENKHGIPVRAVWATVTISVLLTLTNSFETLLLYAGFILQLMASLTVATSLAVKRGIQHFQSPYKPWLQVIFLLFNTWVLVFTFIDRPKESLIGIGILLAGLIIYFFDKPVDVQIKKPFQ